MKIPKTHREPAPHKMPSGATCGPRAACLRPLVYMVVKLHAHWNKHLFNAKFSYREHYWWLTSQTCVNTLINETSVKWIATSQIDRGNNSINLIYCYSSRRATQNMSATRNSPTIGLNLRALLLSSSHSLAALPAKMSAFNSYMRQNAYHRNLKCIFEDLLPCYCYATKAIVEQFTCKFRNLSQQARSGHGWTASS